MSTPMWVTLAVDLVPYAVRVGLAMTLLEVCFRVGIVGGGGQQRRRTAALKVMAIAHSSSVGSLALVALRTHPVLRWQTSQVLRLDDLAAAELFVSPHGETWANLLTSITVGFFIWELAHFRDWATTSRVEIFAMVVHHVVSAILWPLSIHLRIAYFFLMHFELSEISSPWLQLRWFVKVYGGPEIVVSSIFALSFLLVRTVVIAPMFRAIYLARPWDGGLYPHLSLAVRIISIVSLCIPFALNAFWSLQIAQMAWKTYKRVTAGKKKKKKP